MKAELDNKMDQLKEEVRAYKRLCMDKRDSFPSAVVSQPGTSVGQGDQVAGEQVTILGIVSVIGIDTCISFFIFDAFFAIIMSIITISMARVPTPSHQVTTLDIVI